MDDLDLEKDLEALLRDSHPPGGAPHFDREREREVNLFRSGSAPPTVEGSSVALGSLYGGRSGNGVVSIEEMISDPAYLAYYNYNKNLNPSLPPPAVSKEEWILTQRLRAGAIGDGRRKELSNGGGSHSSSLFSSQPGVLMSGLERGNGVVGLGARTRSFADALQLQADLGHSATISRPIPHPIGHNAFDNAVSAMGTSDSQLINLQNGLFTCDVVHPGATSPRLVRVQSVGSSISQSFSPGVGSSPARSLTPDPQLFRRSRSPCLPPVGSRMCDTKKRAIDFNYLGGVSSPMDDFNDVAASFGGLSLSKELVDGENNLQGLSHKDLTNRPESLLKTSSNLSQYMQKNVINKSEADSSRNMSHHFPACNGLLQQSGAREDLDMSLLSPNGQMKLSRQLSANNLYLKVASGGLANTCQSADMTNSVLNRSIPNDYSANQGLPAMLNNQLDAGLTYMGGAEQHSYRAAHQVGSGFQPPKSGLLYAQYMQRTADSELQAAGALDHFSSPDYLGTSDMDLSGYSKAYLGALLAQQKLKHDMPFISNSDGANHGFVGNPAIGLGMQYPVDIIHSPVRSSLSSGRPLKQNERLQRFPSTVRGITGGSMGFCKAESGFIEEGFASSLLEEFKNNKIRSFELSEVVGYAVDFSRDQYGSRFIQEKLETASAEEKHKIFSEILPCARDLMTDVFGNYVIQKFFEHGTEIQRKQLASQIMGHVLPLSFQMYGCRVIQKALEVANVDQQTQMAAELDGSVMKCVRDQNGNHVIQKCIECIPQEKIQFIISAFCGQVVALSSHPYGCRVIQRVLEHCDDAKTQSMIMDEILHAVCTLAQDQYGNYVVQHILQHGKPEECSAIISKLAGQIVKMSQQKFASNVVEKCLTYGSPKERQLLINEMLGSTDENEPLQDNRPDFIMITIHNLHLSSDDRIYEMIRQAMMKDQFGNYVVQKVLETCSDRNRELILSRIRLHLNALKKYTYGKHIVARVEKLLATGERHSVTSSNFL